MSNFKEQLFARIKDLKLSPEGERFLTQALYPPAGLRRVGIPDTNWMQTMLLDSNPSKVIEAPPALAADATWDCLIFLPPGDATMAVIATAVSGTSFASSTSPAAGDKEVSLLQFAPTTPVADSMVLVTRANAGTASTVSGSAVRSGTGAVAFRSTYRSATVHCTASDLYNGGTITAAQVPVQYAETGLRPNNNTYNMGALATAFCPLTEAALTAGVPGCHIDEAKKGVFMPIRHLGPDQPFRRVHGTNEPRNSFFNLSTGITDQYYVDPSVTSSGAQAVSRCVGVAPYILELPAAYPGVGVNDEEPWWNNDWVNKFGHIWDTNYDNMATGVILMRGLHRNASFALQMHVGLEMVVASNSPYNSLVSEPMPYDSRAIAMLYAIEEEMKFAYPASYNAFATVLPLIAQAARYLAPHVLPHLAAAGASLGRAAYVRLAGNNARAVTAPPRDTKVVVKEIERVARAPQRRVPTKSRAKQSSRAVKKSK